MTARIGVVGLSHLGIVASACLAADGLDVIAVDGDATTVNALASGKPPIYEPGLADLLAAVAPAYTSSYSALADRDIVIVAVDTVTDDRNRSDLSALEAHVEKTLPWVPADGVVALMSQVPVGYTRSLLAKLRAGRPDAGTRLYYWVETLVIGDAVGRYRRPERIIIGGPSADAAPEPELDALLAPFGCPVFWMNYESAELTKAAINFYLATSVTFANVLADLCEATGASMRAMLPALRGDRRIGPAAYIRPGLGIGGGNIERDLVHLRELADAHGVDAGMLRFILHRSASRYEWLRQALERNVFTGAPRPRIAIWGLAYKKNTHSTKNSLALRVIEDFVTRARLVIYDPQATLPAPPPEIEIAPSAAAALRDADALLILTDWDEFSAVAPDAIHQTLRRPVVVDAAGVLDRRRAQAAGLRYVAVGEAS